MLMISLYKSLQRKYKDVIYLIDYLKWLISLRKKPLPMGTIFSKREDDYMVYYEVVGYKHDSRSTEVVEEVNREKVK